MALAGWQLSLLSDISPYFIENPPAPGEAIPPAKLPPEQPELGKRVEVQIYAYGSEQWRSGIVVERHYGKAVIWRGRDRTHEIACNRGLRWRYPPEQIPQNIVKLPRRRQQKSGWIERRLANTQRERPTEYKVFRWQEGKKKCSKYLPKAIAAEVELMVMTGEPYKEILKRIKKG